MLRAIMGIMRQPERTSDAASARAVRVPPMWRRTAQAPGESYVSPTWFEGFMVVSVRFVRVEDAQSELFEAPGSVRKAF
jgi:hypothetical protein